MNVELDTTLDASLADIPNERTGPNYLPVPYASREGNAAGRTVRRRAGY